MDSVAGSAVALGGGTAAVGYGISNARKARSEVNDVADSAYKFLDNARNAPDSWHHAPPHLKRNGQLLQQLSKSITDHVPRARPMARNATVAIAGGGLAATLGASHLVDSAAGEKVPNVATIGIGSGLIATGLVTSVYASRQVRSATTSLKAIKAPVDALIERSKVAPLGVNAAKEYAEETMKLGGAAAEALIVNGQAARKPAMLAAGIGTAGAVALGMGTSHLIDAGAGDFVSDPVSDIAGGAVAAVGAGTAVYGLGRTKEAFRQAKTAEPAISALLAHSQTSPTFDKSANPLKMAKSAKKAVAYFGTSAKLASGAQAAVNTATAGAKGPATKAAAALTAGAFAFGLGASHAMDA